MRTKKPIERKLPILIQDHDVQLRQYGWRGSQRIQGQDKQVSSEWARGSQELPDNARIQTRQEE